jgi:two-component system nitrogen regulation sensor histidine kinase NtrY
VVLSEELAVAMGSVSRDYGRYLQLGPVEEIQKRLVWFGSAAIFLLAAGAATWVARVTARRISRPVTELARAADRVAAGDLSHRAEIRADGEIGDLVAAFNNMTGRLERSQEELLRVERIAAWREVAQRIAHEIKNPLTPIQLSAQRLRRRLSRTAGEDTPLVIECTETIVQEVEALRRLVDEFSRFARMPAPVPRPTDLRPLVDGVANLYRESHPHITIVTRHDETLPLIGVDPDHIKRAVLNLVDNAVGAVGAGGDVVVETAYDAAADRVRVTVSDTGHGIAQEDREKLFQPYFSTKTNGMGLGLPIVTEIVNEHGGTIRLEDNDPRGSRFIVELPVTRTTAAVEV